MAEERRNALGLVTDDARELTAPQPEPKPERKRYPSDVKTPAVATRLPREQYEELKAIAAEAGVSMAHAVKAVLLEFLERHRRGEAKLAKAEASGTPEIRRFVTSVVSDS